jgi:tRNA threonylcarbamoyl adenosine modification protein YjeE
MVVLKLPPSRQGPGVFEWIESQKFNLTKSPVIFLLKGPLGSGKTEFVKSAFSYLGGHAQQIQSPTFLKVIEHDIRGVGKIVHADFYRCESVEDLKKINFLESIEDAKYVFVEWPEVFETFLNSEEMGTGYFNQCLKLSLVWQGLGEFKIML